MVHTMNRMADNPPNNIPLHQIEQFRKLILKLFQCCQERMQYQSDKFGLPDSEMRCLLLFGEERYLTAKGIAPKLNVVKSRVTIIVNGLIQKKLIQKVRDPNDSRIILLSLTPRGQAKLENINRFLIELHASILNLILPEQRNTLLANLEVLKLSMEAVKDTME
jgi:DNA-binding MarR family transcriptional regulator